MKEATLVVAMDDLDFGIRDVTFEANMFNRYGTFDRITNRNMENPGYAYLHCDLLDRVTLTTFILRMKSLHLKMHEQHLQKRMFVKVKNFGIKSKSKRGFKKDDMHVVITIESTIIVSSIPAFQFELIPMFFHMDSIRKFKSYIQSWRSTITIIVTSIRGIKDSKGEKKLLTTDGQGEFDQDVIILDNNFKIEYEQLLELYNGGQCIMVLFKNVTTTSKGD